MPGPRCATLAQSSRSGLSSGPADSLKRSRRRAGRVPSSSPLLEQVGGAATSFTPPMGRAKQELLPVGLILLWVDALGRLLRLTGGAAGSRGDVTSRVVPVGREREREREPRRAALAQRIEPRARRVRLKRASLARRAARSSARSVAKLVLSAVTADSPERSRRRAGRVPSPHRSLSWWGGSHFLYAADGESQAGIVTCRLDLALGRLPRLTGGAAGRAEPSLHAWRPWGGERERESLVERRSRNG